MRPRYLVVPSGRPSLPARRPIRLLALLAARNEMRYLPAFMANVAPHVDGIVALDDGSTDGSADYLSSRPEVLKVLRVPPGRPDWDEVGNHRALVAAGVELGADWLVSLDADERVEREFGLRARRVIRRGRLLGLTAYHLRLRELWDSESAYRIDGIWGRKLPARLFAARADHRLDERPLHAFKVPLQARRVGASWPIADLEVYHLRMVHPDDRRARRERYELADPESRWQPGIGYAYLTDERGVTLRRVPPGRGFENGRPGAP